MQAQGPNVALRESLCGPLSLRHTPSLQAVLGILGEIPKQWKLLPVLVKHMEAVKGSDSLLLHKIRLLQAVLGVDTVYTDCRLLQLLCT